MAKYLRKRDRQSEIMYTALGHRQVGCKTFTVYTMAKWIGMSPSTHLRKLLMAMVDGGILAVTSKLHRHNVEKAVFTLTDETLLALSIM